MVIQHNLATMTKTIAYFDVENNFELARYLMMWSLWLQHLYRIDNCGEGLKKYINVLSSKI